MTPTQTRHEFSGEPPKTNMTMEKLTFEDVSPIKNGDCAMLVYWRVI